MDLPHGRLEASGSADRLVAVPGQWLGELLECLPDGVDAFADRLVAPIVADVNAVLDDPAAALPEELAYALSMALARRGFGLVSFERRGAALLLVWRSPPSTGVGFREFAARLTSRVLADVYGLRARGVALSADSASIRILLASPETCHEVRALNLEGVSADAILERLTTGSDA